MLLAAGERALAARTCLAKRRRAFAFIAGAAAGSSLTSWSPWPAW